MMIKTACEWRTARAGTASTESHGLLTIPKPSARLNDAGHHLLRSQMRLGGVAHRCSDSMVVASKKKEGKGHLDHGEIAEVKDSHILHVQEKSSITRGTLFLEINPKALDTLVSNGWPLNE